MYERLHFRRQFLLAKNQINIFPGWNSCKASNYYLYTHPDVEANAFIDQQRSIVIIGQIYDYAHPKGNNVDILNTIATNVRCLGDLISFMKPYAGRYALLYIDKEAAMLMPDALALREIYYCTEENTIACGSQPNLIAKFSNPLIGETNDSALAAFYNNHLRNNRWNPNHKWIGDDTYYENIKHLLPNHYLDLKKREAVRFWPNCSIPRIELDSAVVQSCSFLAGNIEAMVNRHQVMMAVTAGTDSRTLLAASRGVRNQIYYYINDHKLGSTHPDISIPQSIFRGLGIPFHVHEVPPDVDMEFRNIFLNNAFFATDRLLPTIYNVYFKELGDKVNVLGIGEIGRTRFGKEPRNLKPYRLAYKLGYKNDSYAIAKAADILCEMRPAYKKYGVNIMTGFYWEQMLGNWGTTGNSESDISIEEVDPFNSHMLYEIFLGVDGKYTSYKKNVLFKKMINHMWPELLKWPINPPIKKRDKYALLLNNFGLFGLLKEMKYCLYYFKYHSYNK